MFLVQHPGPWQNYVKRTDNVGLHIMEIKDKYMREQLLFEQYISFQQQQQMIMHQMSSGGIFPSTGSLDNTLNSFVVNDYVENYFI